MKLSHAVSGAIRRFSFWVANGTVGYPLLKDVDYFKEFEESPSLMEAVYAVFVNNLELDDAGEVLNEKYAEKRAAQYICQYCVKGYTPEPSFDDTDETELY